MICSKRVLTSHLQAVFSSVLSVKECTHFVTHIMKCLIRLIHKCNARNEVFKNTCNKCVSYNYCPVTKSCPTLGNPTDCSLPGFPGLPYLPEFAQTHVHWVDDAIQPFYPLLSPSPLALNISQHQGLSDESAVCIRWPKYWNFNFNIKIILKLSSFPTQS